MTLKYLLEEAIFAASRAHEAACKFYWACAEAGDVTARLEALAMTSAAFAAYARANAAHKILTPKQGAESAALVAQKRARGGTMVTNTLDACMLIECGDPTPDEYIAAYQLLIDNGDAWKLQGFYGREAARLIDAGLCTRKEATCHPTT